MLSDSLALVRGTEGDLGRQLRGCLYNCHRRNPGGIFNYQNCSLALWEGGERVGLSQRSFVHLIGLEKKLISHLLKKKKKKKKAKWGRLIIHQVAIYLRIKGMHVSFQ